MTATEKKLIELRAKYAGKASEGADEFLRSLNNARAEAVNESLAIVMGATVREAGSIDANKVLNEPS